MYWPKKWAKLTLVKVKRLQEKYREEGQPTQATTAFVTVGTVGGQQERSQYSRVSDTEGCRQGVVGDSEYIVK